MSRDNYPLCTEPDWFPDQFRSMEKTMTGEKTYELKEAMAPATAAKYSKDPVFRGAIGRFPRALREIAKVSAFGFEKHKTPPGGEMNYLNVPDAYNVYSDGLARHLADEKIEGPINSADGGLYHAAQVAWNALARLEAWLLSREGKDRA